MNKTALIAVLLLGLLPGLLSAIPLFRDGQPLADIVVAEDATDPVRYAAQQLSGHLSRATGTDWPIVAEARPGRIPVYLGDSPNARALGFAPESLKSDGFFWKFTPEALVIAGRDYPGGPLATMIHPFRYHEVWAPELKLNAFGEMGTLNGVCRFLEQFAGIRWYMHGELGTVILKLADLDIPETETTDGPDFEYRAAYLCYFPTYPEVAVWQRCLGYGGPFPVAISHSYWDMLKHKDTHPEYFALIDGQRDTGSLSVEWGGNLCLSNPDLIQAWIDHIREYFDEHPAESLYPVNPMDGLRRICDCEECQALFSPELGDDGQFSNYVWAFSNRLAKAVAEALPGKFIGTLAYERYRQPPTCVDKLEPNLAVMICYDRRLFYDPEQKAKVRRLIEAWSHKTDSLYVWTYPLMDYWPPWRGFPRFYPDILQEDIQANLRLGSVRGGFLEAENGRESAPENDFDLSLGMNRFLPGTSHLTDYITSKLLWNANLDVNATLDEYYRLFYGPAEQPMREFWEFAWQICRTRQGDSPFQVYTPEDIRKFLALLDEAASLTEPESPEGRRITLIKNEIHPYVRQIFEANTAIPAVTVARTDEAPIIDGKRDAIWGKAAGLPFREQFTGTPVDVRTTARLLRDAENLYVLVECDEPAMDNLTANCTANDDDTVPIWKDDAVELFIAPDADHPDRFVQIIVNTNGNWWDAAWGAASFPDGTPAAYNSGMAVKVAKADDGWTAEFAIPKAGLALVSPTAPSTWLANFCRDRLAGSPGRNVMQASSWSPVLDVLWRHPERFGHLEFK